MLKGTVVFFWQEVVYSWMAYLPPPLPLIQAKDRHLSSPTWLPQEHINHLLLSNLLGKEKIQTFLRRTNRLLIHGSIWCICLPFSPLLATAVYSYGFILRMSIWEGWKFRSVIRFYYDYVSSASRLSTLSLALAYFFSGFLEATNRLPPPLSLSPSVWDSQCYLSLACPTSFAILLKR